MTSGELPALTRWLIATSDFLSDNWLLVLIAIAAVSYGIWWLLQKDGPKRSYHRFLLRTPITGRLTRGINTARFTRTLSILAGSGVPILDSLKISAEVIENLPMRDAVNEAALRVREGASISKSLAVSKHFPPMMIHLIASGEAGGKLEEMLTRTANYQEREVDGLISTLLGILQPLLIVIMGAVVMTIVLDIDLNRDIADVVDIAIGVQNDRVFGLRFQLDVFVDIYCVFFTTVYTVHCACSEQ